MIRISVDPIAVVAAGVAIACVAIAATGFLSKRWRVGLILAAGAFFGAALLASRSVDAAYYPRVLDAVLTSPPTERISLLQLWSRHVHFNGLISPVGLHMVLWESGYCTNLFSYPGCNALPEGNEAQGIAKDELFDMSRKPHRPL
jgi:hypothetical protein